MIVINLIRMRAAWVKEQLAKRGCNVDFTDLLFIDEIKRKHLARTDELKAKRNKISAAGKPSPEVIKQMQDLGKEIAIFDAQIAELEEKIQKFLSALPNIPANDVIAGGKENNRPINTFGEMPQFNFKPKDHVELCTSLGLIDYERAAKISGAGTWIYTGKGAMLEWALLNYFIDFHIANGYTFIMPPHLLNWESGFAAGQFPKFADDVFITDLDPDPRKSRFLLPTAETALINLHRGEILPPEKLPIKYAGYSPCYRKEAGSYRTSERGMIRGYQFNKIEMFIFCKADESDKFFAELVRNAEKLVEGLGLHFQTVALAAGDMSAAMAKTYDIEVYIPSMAGYKEVSSVSNASDYQARRANIRTRNGNANELVHTLNASGLATSRIIPAIVEQFQQADGSVLIPPALHRYMHGVTVLSKDK